MTKTFLSLSFSFTFSFNKLPSEILWTKRWPAFSSRKIRDPVFCNRFFGPGFELGEELDPALSKSSLKWRLKMCRCRGPGAASTRHSSLVLTLFETLLDIFKILRVFRYFYNYNDVTRHLFFCLKNQCSLEVVRVQRKAF